MASARRFIELLEPDFSCFVVWLTIGKLLSCDTGVDMF